MCILGRRNLSLKFNKQKHHRNVFLSIVGPAVDSPGCFARSNLISSRWDDEYFIADEKISGRSLRKISSRSLFRRRARSRRCNKISSSISPRRRFSYGAGHADRYTSVYYFRENDHSTNRINRRRSSSPRRDRSALGFLPFELNRPNAITRSGNFPISG